MMQQENAPIETFLRGPQIWYDLGMTNTAENPQDTAIERPVRYNQGPLPNHKHERFCQAIIKGATANEAYIEAGYASNRGNASALKCQESIKRRIAALQAQMAQRIIEKAPITKGYVLQQSVKLHELSMANVLDEGGGFVGSAAASAARALDQIGRHVDVQAFKDASDINVNITVDAAIAKLASLDVPAIDGEYEDVTSDD
tara:strand:- start:1825 stop:2427 length:603 start_codon:yes stop_codon:yes gene_type:complete